MFDIVLIGVFCLALAGIPAMLAYILYKGLHV